MDIDSFYERPMVARIAEIFDHPSPPAVVTERQFDDCQEELELLARKKWHEIGREDYWCYLLDLCYVPLQRDLFNYLFPPFLIKWWEGQLDQTGGPSSETDIYRAIDNGGCLYTMMDEERRNAVHAWMVDAYIQGVDAWSGRLSTKYNPSASDRLHGPLHSFNAIGSSLPIVAEIWSTLSSPETSGRAQWWLVLITGLVYRPNTCPFIPPWTRVDGGGAFTSSAPMPPFTITVF